MKASSSLISYLLFIVCLTSFTSKVLHDLEIQYSVKGVNHDLKDGLTLSEFNKVTLTTNHDLEVESFHIMLTRGNRPVKKFEVDSNTFNLRKFTGNARKGDYIVIEVIKLSSPRQSCQALFKAIPVN